MRRRGNLRALAGLLLFFLFCASRSLAQTGTVLNFGYNPYGQIGDNTTVSRSLATSSLHISGIKAVACGAFHTLALDSHGVVWAWGLNNFGQLGTGDYTARSQQVAVLAGIKAI